MTLARRRFLQLSGGAAATWATSPWWLQAARAATTGPPSAGRKLLVIFMAGGNDGLNTVIPYGYSEYYAARPTLGYKPDRVLPIPGSSALGLHPNLVNVHDLYTQGRVAIVQGVGYDKPDLSHFISSDLWQSGSPNHTYGTGWLGRWLDQSRASGPLHAVAVGDFLPLILIGERDQGVSLTSLQSFQFGDGADGGPTSDTRHRHDDFLRLAATQFQGDAAPAYVESVRDTVTAVRAVNGLAPPAPAGSNWQNEIALAMTLLSSSLGVRIAVVTFDGFDDHSGEEGNHPGNLKSLDQAIGTFRDLVAKQPDADDYLLMTFSEFGRRPAENGSGGTDHGTAGPLFVVGSHVVGGLHGAQPGLKPSQLDDNGNLVREVEFREVYSTILDDWLGGPSSQDVLGVTSADGLHPVKFLR